MNIELLYESTNTDGYNVFGDGKYFLEKRLAVVYSKHKHKGYAATPQKVPALRLGEEYYLLKQTSPIYLSDSEGEKEELRQAALNKLTKEERELLGL